MFWVCSYGGPFGHKNFKHVGFVAASKVNILEAEDATTGKHVVLKLTYEKDDHTHELDFLKLLSKSAARDFVVELRGAEEPVEGSDEQRFCLVLEKLGQNLSDFLDAHRDLGEHERLSLGLNLVQAVQALHRAGVIHCDFKPQQVLLVGGGRLKLKVIDFDSARHVGSMVSMGSLTVAFAAPGVIRAEAEGTLSALVPSTAVDLWPLGLMLAQIFHDDSEPLFRTEEEAREVLLAGPEARLEDRLESRLCKLPGRIQRAVRNLLAEDPTSRWSTSKVLKEPIFQTGNYTLIQGFIAGQDKVLAKVEESQAELEASIQATQRLLVEYGDSRVPRLALLVPADMPRGESNVKKRLDLLASEAGFTSFYDLYLLCEGCALFPSTACSCDGGFAHPVRVAMPGEALKRLAPALKAAAVLYAAAAVVGNVAGVRLPRELPGVGDLVEFAHATIEFVELLGIDVRGAADDGRVEDAAAASGARAHGAAYTALEDLLVRAPAWRPTMASA